MKKILKHLCLCLCLVMVGFLCFNAKPKAEGAVELDINVNVESYSTPDFIENVDPMEYVFYLSSISLGTSTFKLAYRKFANNEIDKINLFTYDYYNSNFTIINQINDERYIFDLKNKFLGVFINFYNFTYDDFDNITHYTFYFDLVLIDIFTHSFNNLGRFAFSIPGYPSYFQYDDNIINHLTLVVPSTQYYQLYQLYASQNLDRDKLLYDIFVYYELNDTSVLIANYLDINAENLIDTNILKNYLDSSYNEGVEEGLQIGFEQGIASIENIPGSFLTPIFEFIDNVFNLEVMPNVKIGYFIIIPLVFGVLGVVLYFWRKD